MDLDDCVPLRPEGTQWLLRLLDTPQVNKGTARTVQGNKAKQNKEYFKELCQSFVGSWVIQRQRGAH